MRAEQNYHNSGVDIVMSSAMNMAEKSVVAPTNAIGHVLGRLQELQTKLSKA